MRTHTFNKSGAYYEMFSPGGGAFIEAIKPLSRWAMFRHFSAFGRRLSLRPREHCARHGAGSRLLHLGVGTFIEALAGRQAEFLRVLFLHLRAGTFIEASLRPSARSPGVRISPSSGGDFVMTLDVNREVSCGLSSPGLETTLVSRTGLFSLNMKMGLDVVLLRISHGSYLSLK